MQPTIRSIIHLAAALFECAALLGTTANAQSSYPDKPVRIIVGFAAGGPTDVIARVVADKLSAGLGRQFVVVNQPGAGSNTASGMVAQAPADGYTLLAVSTEPATGSLKLGHPVPLSNLRFETNSGWSQPAHEKVPARFS